MKRAHSDDNSNKNKRFAYSVDASKKMNQNMSTGHGTSSYYSYPPSMSWGDPRMDPRSNMNMYGQQWGSNTSGSPQQNFSPIYNPMQPPPPPLPLERPPVDTPPPPPPHVQTNAHMLHNSQNLNQQRRQMNNNMRRRLPMGASPGPSNYMQNMYKRNDRFQNSQKNNSNYTSNTNQSQSPGPPKTKGEKSDDLDKPKPLKVNKKARRKPMSERYTCKKEWNKEDAMRALTLENAYNHLIKKVPMLILRFPDPELNKALIHSYSSAIETVHFQQPSRARYCFVQLKPDADIEGVKRHISGIDFGTGKISVENKVTRHEVAEVTPEQLDPYTLYVGNLPTKLNVTIFKEKFPTAKRIDIGYAQRTKFTRYAFLHYDNVDESMEAFKSTYNLTIDARSLVVRFRRNKGSVGLSEKGKKVQKPGEAEDDIKKEDSTKTNTKLFDAGWNTYETRDDVFKETEKLQKEGCAETLDGGVFGAKIKEEPMDEPVEYDDECLSDDFTNTYGFGEVETFEDDDANAQSDLENSEDEYGINDNSGIGSTESFDRRPWDQSQFSEDTENKSENFDDYGLDEVSEINASQPHIDQSGSLLKDNDKSDLFSRLNPDESDEDGGDAADDAE